MIWCFIKSEPELIPLEPVPTLPRWFWPCCCCCCTPDWTCPGCWPPGWPGPTWPGVFIEAVNKLLSRRRNEVRCINARFLSRKQINSIKRLICWFMNAGGSWELATWLICPDWDETAGIKTCQTCSNNKKRFISLSNYTQGIFFLFGCIYRFFFIHT